MVHSVLYTISQLRTTFEDIDNLGRGSSKGLIFNPMSVDPTFAVYKKISIFKPFEPGSDGLGYAGNGFAIPMPGLVRLSHEAVRRITYDANLLRPKDLFINFNVSAALPGFIPEGVAPLMLSQGTADPARVAKRVLMADMIPALARHHKDLPFKVPAHVTVGADWGPMSGMTDVMHVIGFTVFRQIFGVELTQDELGHLTTWALIMGPVAVSNLNYQMMASRVQAAFAEIEARVVVSDFAKDYVAEANRRGMDGVARLRELIIIVSFAGFGGMAGTAGSLLMILIKIWEDFDKHAQLFKADPEAFVLEVERLNPTVAGVNPFVAGATQTVTLGNGRQHTETAGDLACSLSMAANRDPAVFGGPTKDPAYANRFIPGRENADRLLTWINELRDMRKCANMSGCPAAPRPCPGAELAIRTLVRATSYFVERAETARQSVAKAKGEL